jgi:hypothetical protein
LRRCTVEWLGTALFVVWYAALAWALLSDAGRPIAAPAPQVVVIEVVDFLDADDVLDDPDPTPVSLCSAELAEALERGELRFLRTPEPPEDTTTVDVETLRELLR